MSLTNLLRLGRGPTPQPPTPRRAGTATPPPAAPAEIRIDAGELATAWSPATRRLALTVPAPLAKGRRVVVLVAGAGAAVIPLAGAVAEATPSAGCCAVEVAVDEDRQAAVHRILAFVEGTAREPRERAPRYRLALPAFVASREVNAYMTTFSVSRGGCGLAWSGTAPQRGAMLQVRLGSGARSATFHARVCWTRTEARGVRVGVRFVVGEDAALVTLLPADVRAAVAT